VPEGVDPVSLLEPEDAVVSLTPVVDNGEVPPVDKCEVVLGEFDVTLETGEYQTPTFEK
jgi:hypothetical protein